MIWLYGLSGSGKSALAVGLEQRLFSEGFTVVAIDGDSIRSGLNADLGFSDEDRYENIRRVAEMAHLLMQRGLVVICSFITPTRALRQLAKKTIGHADYLEVYVAASFEGCARRDPKGLYSRASQGDVKQFTGVDSPFEPPLPGEATLVLDTEAQLIGACLARLHAAVAPRLKLES